MVKSAERAVRILEAIAQARRGLTHTEMCHALRIPSGSLTPLLNTLCSLGYLQMEPSGKKYLLGPSILFLARRYQEELDIVQIGRPFLSDLVRLTGEAAAITIQNGDHSTVVAKVNSSLPVSPSLNLGDSAPLYAGASGKIYLAFRSDEEIRHYLSTVELRRLTPRTHVRPDEIWRELRAIRGGALSYSRENMFEGVTAVAAPVRDYSGKVVATLIISAPTSRMGLEKEVTVEKALREAAAAFSAKLGFGSDEKKGVPARGRDIPQELVRKLVRHG
ncbi:MAG: IclR family transcriptional regulator [Deltaproteobacteria bacterium]|nr:IclR family transcriptional regulator [Deltaproteobacteria bacterium]